MNRPQTFGPYDLLERVNVGGMAEVFRAVERTSGRVVALKRILPGASEDDEFIEMFLDESRIASSLDHPNIAKIFDVGQLGSTHYLAIEYVNGKDLRTILDRARTAREPLPLEFVVYVIASVASGLDYAHQRRDSRGRPLNLVHRDVSPQNVLVSFDGDVKLIDFGIAKAAGRLTRTEAGSIKGKFGYMSPEQVRGLPVDRRSDVFSLGICLWELLTLERLFEGPNEILVMEKIRNATVPAVSGKNPSVPSELERIVFKALAKEVGERYAAASELHADLEAFARAALPGRSPGIGGANAVPLKSAAGTQGTVANRARAAEYMRRSFAGNPALNAASREENLDMGDNKGGSDLDVFEGLAKKKPTPSVRPPAPPGPMGPPSQRGAAPVPPPPVRQKTLLGMAMPNLPPPSGLPMPPPPSQARPSGPLPAVTAPPSRQSLPMPPPPGRMSNPPAPPMPGGRVSLPGAPPPIPGAPPPMAAPPPAAPLPPPPAAAAPVDMDWDDEDEKTSIFDKAPDQIRGMRPGGAPLPAAGAPAAARTLIGTGAAALVQSSGGAAVAAPPPPAPVAAPLPPPRAAVAPMAAPPAPAIPAPAPVPREFPTVPPAAQRSGSKAGIIIAAVVGVAAVLGAVVFFLAQPKTGRVAVFVTASGGKSLDRLTVFVDGAKKCETSPCTLELGKGVHAIKAMADGYASAEQGATVEAGKELAVNFKLEKASAGTGIKVAGKQEGVKLFVDGKEVGPLPQELKDMAPGEHKLLFKGSERYAPQEKAITVAADEIQDLGSIELKVVRGLATFDVRTSGAKVLLVSGGERRELKDFSKPLDIETSKNWTIEATKSGYEDYSEPIKFDDKAEKTFVIALREKGKPAPAAEAGGGTTSTKTETKKPDEKPSGGGGGNCTLNINSIPVSNVVLDGRPLGGTPKLGISVSAGSHSVTFVHPEYGKKSTGTTCKAGETKTVAMRLSN